MSGLLLLLSVLGLEVEFTKDRAEGSGLGVIDESLDFVKIFFELLWE